MRKLLFMLLLLPGLKAGAQNLSVFDLTNLTKMNNGDAHNFLGSVRMFREFYMETVNGLNLESYRYSNKNGIKETVVVGDGEKAKSGVFLRTVTYTSSDARYIASLIPQAARAGLTKNFEGADESKDIYLYDNYLYSVSFYISSDKKSGTIVVKQKEHVTHYD